MSKRGTTLIEALISILVVSIAVVTLLEALNVGISGTLELNRKVSALNLAKSQLTAVASQPYNASTGNLASVYQLILPSANISDTINYNISGEVRNVSANQSLQQITVNVSYLYGKRVQLIGFKGIEGSLPSPPDKGQLVTDVIEDMPLLQGGGWALGCLWGGNSAWNTSFQSCGTYTGYYHVFNTSQSGNISAAWRFKWTNELYGTLDGCWTWGSPYIGIYDGTPAWVNLDAQGNVEPDGIIFRGGCNGTIGPGEINYGGCMPSNDSTCTCAGYTINASPDVGPIVMNPANCSNNWAVVGVENTWNYEKTQYSWNWLAWWFNESDQADMGPSGTYEFSVTTPSPQGPHTYTVLFFNGEDRISYQTLSASVTYIH